MAADREVRVDWARIGEGERWHAFARDYAHAGEPGFNWNGETQLLMAVCALGPGVAPYSATPLAPSCSLCKSFLRMSDSGAPFMVLVG